MQMRARGKRGRRDNRNAFTSLLFYSGVSGSSAQRLTRLVVHPIIDASVHRFVRSAVRPLIVSSVQRSVCLQRLIRSRAFMHSSSTHINVRSFRLVVLPRLPSMAEDRRSKRVLADCAVVSRATRIHFEYTGHRRSAVHFERSLAQADVALHDIKLPRIDGCDPFLWRVASVPSLMQYFCDNGVAYKSLVQETLARHGNSWSGLLYHDGLTPGNVLRPDKKRKTVVFYYAPLQFGDALRFEEFWISLAIFRLREKRHRRRPFGNGDRFAAERISWPPKHCRRLLFAP